MSEPRGRIRDTRLQHRIKEVGWGIHQPRDHNVAGCRGFARDAFQHRAMALQGEEAELITLYLGAEVDVAAGERLAEGARAAIPGVAVELARGDQPIERVLVSLE